MMKIVRDEEEVGQRPEPQAELVAEVDGKMVTADDLLAALESATNKPTPEEVVVAELEYQQAATDFSTKEYEVGTLEEAADVYKFFIEFLDKYVFWTKNGWMGVIKLNDEIQAKFLEFQTTPAPFRLGYQALEFTMFMLSNPGGTGLKSALAIEQLAELYMYVMEQVSNKLDEARLNLKDIQFAYDKWVSMQQGFYLEREDGVEVPPETDGENEEKVIPTENL